MNSIILKSAAIAFASVAASLLLTLIIVPAMGFPINRTIWLTSTLCPLVLAWVASASTFWQSDRLKNAHRELARAHAQLAAAHRRLAEKASRDDMTGMLNRESFFAALDGSRRKSDRGALLIIDADHFKSINDRLGHDCGDQALKLIAQAIKGQLRGGDLVGRIGGEEFGVFLPGVDPSQSWVVAESIRRRIREMDFSPGGRPCPLSVSIGGTSFTGPTTYEEIFSAADRRLYTAKSNGRDQVSFDPAGVSPVPLPSVATVH